MLVLASRIHVVNYYELPISFFATIFVRNCTSEVQWKREKLEWMVPTRFRLLNEFDWNFTVFLQKGSWKRKWEFLQLLILRFFLCFKPTVCFRERPKNVLQYFWEVGMRSPGRVEKNDIFSSIIEFDMEELPRVVLGQNCQKPNCNAIIMEYWVNYLSLELSLFSTCIKQILFVISYCKVCGDNCKEKDMQVLRLLLPIIPIWNQIFCSVAVFYEKKTSPRKGLIFLKFCPKWTYSRFFERKRYFCMRSMQFRQTHPKSCFNSGTFPLN